MILTEEVKFRGINKQISPSSVDEEKNRMIVNPITDALNFRYLSSDSGDELLGLGVKGTTEIVNGSLPAGDNKCIGWCEDKQRNCIFYFVFNSNGDHCIFKYTPETDTITLVIQATELNFQDDRRYLINSASVINDLLIWNDAFNETGCINTTRSYVYAGFVEDHIRITKPQPNRAIIIDDSSFDRSHAVFRSSDSNLTVNKINTKNYQFSYRVIFLDDEKSNLAPYSLLSWGDRFADVSNDSDKVKIKLQVFLPNAITYAKKIQVLYREGTIDTWKVFANLNPISGSSYILYYSGTEFIEEVPESESSKIFDVVPNFSEASCIQKNRLFVTDNESGFDDPNTPAIGITKPFTRAENVLDAHWVPGGRKKFGIALFDKKFRSLGVISPTETTFITENTTVFNYPYTLSHSFSFVTIGTGSKTFTLIDKEIVAYASIGYFVEIKDYAQVGGLGMLGTITSKNVSAGTITVNVTNAGTGSGLKSSWVVKILPAAVGTVGIKRTLDIAISGSLSIGTKAKYYSVVRSEDLIYDEYFEVPVRPLFYKFDKTGDYSPTAQEKVIDGKIFTKEKPASGDTYSKVYLQLPRETPIALDDSFFVRLISGVSSAEVTKTEKILAVDGDYVIVNNFNVSNWFANSSVATGPNNFIIKVAIFRLRNEEEATRYFEITQRYEVDTNGTLPTTSFVNVPGDAYLMSNRYTFRSFKNNPTYQSKVTLDETVYSLSPVGVVGNNTGREAPKLKGGKKLIQRILAKQGIDEVADVQEGQNVDLKPFVSKKRLGDFLPANVDKFSNDAQLARIKNVLVNSDGLSAAYRNFIIDYTKKDWSKGIQLLEIEASKRVFRSDTKIRFSDKFVQDTNINGLNSFEAANAHTLSSERGKIKRLVPVGNNILAVHERACTSLYIEEGIIRAANGSSALSVTKDVIGHDNKLVLEYGAYHGESVAKNDLGHAFGFDVYKGVVWRYTNEGLSPISMNGMDQYFKAKGDEYLPIKDTCKIIGAIDFDNKEYILTFRKADGSGETWAFNYKADVWSHRYSFIPEMYASLGKTLLSFKNGRLWKHNVNSTYNNFHGLQYGRSVRIAVNPYSGTKKVYNGLVIGAARLATDPDEIIVRCYCGSQETYMRLSEFDILQGLHESGILRDINTPNIDVGKNALRDGDDLRGDFIEVEILTSLPEKLPISFFEVTYNKSEFSK